MPDVWLAYGQSPEPVDLLLTPHTGTTPGALAAELQARLSQGARVAHSDTYVVARLSFDDLISQALPLTRWWHDQIVDADEKRPDETFLPGLAEGRRPEQARTPGAVADRGGRPAARSAGHRSRQPEEDRAGGDHTPRQERPQLAPEDAGRPLGADALAGEPEPSGPVRDLGLTARGQGGRSGRALQHRLQLDRLGGDRLRCRREASGAVRPRRRRAAQACIRARRGDEGRAQQLARGRDLRLHDAAGAAGRRREARPGTDGRGAGSAPGPATGAEERALDRLGGAGADPARAARPGVVQTAGPRPWDARGRES